MPKPRTLFRHPPRFIEPPTDPRPEPPTEAPALKAPPPTRASRAAQAEQPLPVLPPSDSPRPFHPPAQQPPWNPYAHLPIWRPRITPTLFPRTGTPRPERFGYFPAAFTAYSSLPRASRITLVEEVITDSHDDGRIDVTSDISTIPPHHYQYQGDTQWRIRFFPRSLICMQVESLEKHMMNQSF